MAEPAMMPVVPYVRKKLATGFTNSFSDSRTTVWISFVPARILREERQTIALSFLEPITAPRPLRAARRPRSLQMPAMNDSVSPAGPMHAMLAFLPYRSLSAVSTSIASMPQRSLASLISTWSSWITR